MQHAQTDIIRRVVPRWRSVDRTPLVELQNHKGEKQLSGAVLDELRTKVETWRVSPTVEAAQDVVWASAVFGRSKENEEVLSQIIKTESLSSGFRERAQGILASPGFGQFSLDLYPNATEEFLRQQVRILRKIWIETPRDPLLLVELARVYCQLGEKDKATWAMEVAFGLAPSSRYVLRAAVRLFVHTRNLDRALQMLSKGNPGDPWIQASIVSVSDLSGRKLYGHRRIRELLEADLPPEHLAELAGSLATLEYRKGSRPRARKLFKVGSEKPNDNMVAQLHWASKQRMFDFPEELLLHSLTYEARALHAKKNRKWDEAVKHCEQWLIDEPISARPAHEGSYIAAEFQQDYATSAHFCEKALIANPNDFTLLNNAAFSYAQLGDLKRANELLRRADINKGTESNEVYLTATKGIVKFREGDVEAGSALYSDAIALATKQKNTEAAQFALVHYLIEITRKGVFLTQDEREKIDKLLHHDRASEEAKLVYEATLRPLLDLAERHKTNQPERKTLLEQLLNLVLPSN